MSDLFGTLKSVARALDAQRYGIDVAGQNIANVNTPGWSRRTVDLVALAPERPHTAGRGVDVTGVRAMRDRLLDTRLHYELPQQARESAKMQALGVVEAALGLPGTSIDGEMEKLFDAFADLSEVPTGAAQRENVLIRGEGVAASFRDMASRLEDARRDADRQVRGIADDINSLLSRIASLNVSISAASTSEKTLHVKDEQAQLVRELSELIDIQVLPRDGMGGVDIALGHGRPAVVGATVYQLTVSNTPPDGYAALALNGTAVTSEISGGRMGGMLQVRDVHVLDYQNRLDTLAFELVAQVNALHSAGFDQNGAAGGNFFEFTAPPAGVAGAARLIQVRPALAADSRLVVAGSTTDAGDNQTARGLANLRSALVLNGNTATLADAWGHLVYRVARDTRVAKDESDSRKQIVRQVEALRDEVSGVSLDEEAMNLMKFQRAYEANARLFQVIDRTLDMLLGMTAR